MRRRIDEHWVFWRAFRENFYHTGAVLPSGHALARKLVRFVAGDHPPRHVLEAGPGTGAVTRWLIQALGSHDRLDLVEINPRFAANLRDKFAHDPRFQPVADRATVLEHGLEQLPGRGVYDVIVSGLPLNNFSVAHVEEVLATYARLLRPGGILSYFEYAGVRRLKQRLVAGAERQRLTAVDRLLRDFLHEHEQDRDLVWANVPPAWVHHLRLGSSREAGAESLPDGGADQGVGPRNAGE